MDLPCNSTTSESSSTTAACVSASTTVPVPVPELTDVINGESDTLREEAPMEIAMDDEASPEAHMEVVKDDEASPARLVINKFNDDDEEALLMTIEEAQNYILSKVEGYLRDPTINPLLIFKNQIKAMLQKIESKSEEFIKLNKLFDALYRDQMKFLRHIGVIPKVETKTVGVSVDLPWLPDSMPGLINENTLNNKKETIFMPMAGGSTSKLTKKEPSGPIECIDLTDDVDAPDPPVSANVSSSATPKSVTTTADSAENRNVSASSSSASSTVTPPLSSSSTLMSKDNFLHPAPLPATPSQANESEIPPKPRLKISVDKNGIVLQWDLPPEAKNMKITGFEIVGYQEKNSVPASSSLWKKIGCVDLMSLPMSCTLTQFVENFKYHFSIRAFCKDSIFGHFSDPASITFVPQTNKD